MIEVMFYTTEHASWILKVYIGLRYRSKLQHIIDSLDEPIFSEVDVKSAHWLRSSYRLHYRITTAFLFVGLGSVAAWAVSPFLAEGDTSLPIFAWYPVDQNKQHWFIVLFVFQTITTIFAAASDVSYDMLLPGTLTIACAQLNILCDKLEDKYGRIRQQAMTGENPTNAQSVGVDRKTRDVLANCVEHHVRIIRFVREVEELFTGVSFMQFIVSCLVVCFTAFKMTVVADRVELFGMVMFMIGMLFELFVICYFGNELIITSDRLTSAAYSGLWYESSVGNRRTIFIMMERAKQPLQVNGFIFTLSLSTFVSVMRSSYSYFAVLQQVNE